MVSILILYAGVEHIGRDMFHNIPNGDAIMLKVDNKDLVELFGRIFQNKSLMCLHFTCRIYSIIGVMRTARNF